MTTPQEAGYASQGLASEREQPFAAMAQGEVDFTLEAIPVKSGEHGTMLTICHPDCAIYITREQAAKFFGFALSSATGTVGGGEANWQPMETAKEQDGLITIWIDWKNGTTEMWNGCYHDAICDDWRTVGPSGHLRCVPARFVTNWIKIPPPGSAAVSGHVARDAERLDYVLNNCGFLVQIKVEGATRYQIWTQDEDEVHHILSGDDTFATPREAIDAAINTPPLPGSGK